MENFAMYKSGLQDKGTMFDAGENDGLVAMMVNHIPVRGGFHQISVKADLMELANSASAALFDEQPS
jgi:hypothetical protein